MKKNYETMTLLTFQEKYNSELKCRERLFQLRWPNGFVCPECGDKDFYYMNNRPLYQCKKCKHQTSVTAKTVMHGTRTPLLKWFWAIFLTANDKRGLSALSLSKEIEVSYWVAWTMLHKIRTAMKDRDADYKLAGLIEVDDSYFGGRKDGSKRGRGTGKTEVLIEVATYDESMSYAKFKVIDKVNEENIRVKIESDIEAKQIIKTDGFTAYRFLEKLGHKHIVEVVNGKKAHELLKWVHILASNAKAFLKGTYHGNYAEKHFQRYLDEFCYRLNRRKWEGQLFDRLVTACVNSFGITYAELTQ